MALGLPNFNRIIDVSFITATESKYDSRGFSLNGVADQRSIVCARHGRKPDIEITGTFTTTDYLPVFNISLKNLYLELQ